MEAIPEKEPAGILGARARTVGLAAAAAGVLVAVAAPRATVLGPRFTVSREAAMAVADSVVRTRAVKPPAWTRLANTATDTLEAWPRFLVAHEREELAASLATTYAIPVWWIVRYVRTQGPLSTRAEEWRVRVRPDGLPIDVQMTPGALLAPRSCAPGSIRCRCERRGSRRLRVLLDTT